VQREHAAILWVAMILGVLHGHTQAIDYCLWRGQIRITHREADDIYPGGPALGYLLLCAGKVVWREVVN